MDKMDDFLWILVCLKCCEAGSCVGYFTYTALLWSLTAFDIRLESSAFQFSNSTLISIIVLTF